jgi:autotransporter translocation and assembly factor TamB
VFTNVNFKAAIKVAVISASLLSSSSSVAQTSPETATALTSPSVSNSWSAKGSLNFYYSFTSAPGELQVTLDTRSDNPGCGVVRITILDRERRDWRNDRQMYGYLFKLACTSSGTPKIENIRIPERRPLLMRVNVEASNSSTAYSGNYTITLSGTFEGQPQLQQIDPKLLREQRFFDRYPLPTPSLVPQ